MFSKLGVNIFKESGQQYFMIVQSVERNLILVLLVYISLDLFADKSLKSDWHCQEISELWAMCYDFLCTY